jgi:hypothetical protein
MTKENAKHYLPLIQAMSEGKTIQIKNLSTGEWFDTAGCNFLYPPENYRVKPEPQVLWINLRAFQVSVMPMPGPNWAKFVEVTEEPKTP